ncbi:spore coat protein C [Bacillus sp. SIMBA_074]|uniref:YfjL-like protein n=1 Tax=Bacillus TaxID=1386 RepID=UPI00103DDA83|nr:spore coat protein C [Bacillus mycoides]MBJ7993793.1 spore coat protein C [Bacillus cereus]MDM5429820.1 spore coat protein C [Bacillus mycoides]MED1401727.1 spore coat protein C [Bacillus mycoides]QWH83569.1 spore coat protein C [Bacillus mycoides]QWI94638.1 spore coat protein C [Bacillus mycoides]
MNTKNKKIAMGTLLLTSIIGVIGVSLYFTYYGTPWGKQTAIAESKNYITKYFNLDAEVKNTSYNAKMNSYAISFETSVDGEFTIEYKSPNNFNISPGVQEYLSKHYKFAE